MKVAFEEIQKTLIGLGFCYIKVGYGEKLRLGLGNKIFYKEPKLKDKFFGEWDISSLFCSWRISEGKKLICGYDDDISFCKQAINCLSFGCISDVVQLSYFDIRIVFNTGLIIDYFLQSTDGASLVILGEKEKIAYELFFDGCEKTIQKKAEINLQKLRKF